MSHRDWVLMRYRFAWAPATVQITVWPKLQHLGIAKLSFVAERGEGHVLNQLGRVASLVIP